MVEPSLSALFGRNEFGSPIGKKYSFGNLVPISHLKLSELKGNNTWWNGEDNYHLPLTILSFSKFLWCWGLEISQRGSPFWRKFVQIIPKHSHPYHKRIMYQFLNFYLFQMPITYNEPNENFPFIFVPFQWENFKLFDCISKNKLLDTFWPTYCRRKWLIYKKLS